MTLSYIPENHNFMISGINLGHLGAFLVAKNASGGLFFVANLGTSPISLRL
jgi:hypothetical protein